VEIARELDVGCHAIDADYTLPRPQESHKIRVFGFENHPDYPYRVELEGLPVEFDPKGESFDTRIQSASNPTTTALPIVPAAPVTSAVLCSGADSTLTSRLLPFL